MAYYTSHSVCVYLWKPASFIRIRLPHSSTLLLHMAISLSMLQLMVFFLVRFLLCSSLVCFVSSFSFYSPFSRSNCAALKVWKERVSSSSSSSGIYRTRKSLYMLRMYTHTHISFCFFFSRSVTLLFVCRCSRSVLLRRWFMEWQHSTQSCTQKNAQFSSIAFPINFYIDNFAYFYTI